MSQQANTVLFTEQRFPRLLIAAASSGTGKTTVTCGLLQALINRGKQVRSFKCGPDYIDPMFHSEVIGVPSGNLDLFFMKEDRVRYLLGKAAEDADLSIIEGVMGYYDGLAGKSDLASAYDVARVTKTPVVLLVGCKGMSVSIAAQIKGFLEFRKDSRIKGVILNRLSPMLYPEIKELIERELPVKVLGYLPELLDCGLESRHLGLVTAAEVTDLKERLNRVADQIEQSVDLDGLITLAKRAEPFWMDDEKVRESIGIFPESVDLSPSKPRPKIAIARDKAFCFYYQDSLDLLTELGAELVPFSPLTDEKLPEGISGLILGGGYPELYAEQLSKNTGMRSDIRSAIQNGLPTIAECGGFMYLHDEMEDNAGAIYPMVGTIRGKSFKTGKLTRFGYIMLTAQKDNLLCKAGEQIAAHEFHYWDSTENGDAFLAEKPLRKRSWSCIHAEGNLFAGYPHMHFYGNPVFAVNFVKCCAGYTRS